MQGVRKAMPDGMAVPDCCPGGAYLNLHFADSTEWLSTISLTTNWLTLWISTNLLTKEYASHQRLGIPDRINHLYPFLLGPWNRNASVAWWQMVSGDEVSEREIRPLQILTGGSPRLLIIIGDFAQHRSLRQLMEELVRLVDDHTEYFRGHLEVFAKTERRVYLAVIDLWRPSTTGEVAARTRMDVRAVSALLGRLVERGAVIVEGNGKKRTYAAAERLYSIYYKLRRERDEAAVVRNLIHFMELFYNEAEMDEWSRALMSEAMQWPALCEGIRRATAESSHVGRVVAGEEWRSIEQVSDGTTALDYERANRILDQVVVATDKSEFQRRVRIADQFFASLRDGARTAPESVFARILNVKGYAHEKLGDFDSAFASWEEVVERFGATNEPELQAQVAMSLVNKGVVLDQLGKTESAIATFNKMVERFGIWNKRPPEDSFAAVHGAGRQGRDARSARPSPVGVGSVRRSDPPLRNQRHTGTTGRSCYSVGLQGNFTRTTWRNPCGNRSLRRGGQTLRRK